MSHCGRHDQEIQPDFQRMMRRQCLPVFCLSIQKMQQDPVESCVRLPIAPSHERPRALLLLGDHPVEYLFVPPQASKPRYFRNPAQKEHFLHLIRKSLCSTYEPFHCQRIEQNLSREKTRRMPAVPRLVSKLFDPTSLRNKDRWKGSNYFACKRPP